jgi:small subunit ribosomal protein S3Ae
MAKKQKTKAIKEVKKRWMNIIAPELFSRAYLGETLVAEPNEMLNKTIVVNLMDLTKSIKQQNYNVKFKVNEIKENEALTEIQSYLMNGASIKRMVRRSVEKLDDSFIVTTSDGKFVRVKPLVITRSSTKGTVATLMRKEIRNFIIKDMEGSTYEMFVRNVISGKLPAGLSQRLNKIYPVRIATIRMFELVASIKGKKLPKAEDILLPEKDEELPAEEGAEDADAEESADEEAEDAPKKKKGKKELSPDEEEIAAEEDAEKAEEETEEEN